MKISDIYKILAWDIINPSLLNIKKGKKYNFDNFVGLNLGCGINNPKNWIGIDGGITHYFVKKSPIFLAKLLFHFFNMSNNYTFNEYRQKTKTITLIHHELSFGIPFKDGSVPNIYSSHFFEHLFKNDSLKLLEECIRVLKPNGRIRIVVPSLDSEVQDIKVAIKKYDGGNFDEIQKYVTTKIVGYQDKYSNHKFMFNFSLLKNILLEVGFRDVKECKFREGEIPDVNLLDTRKESIFVEAIKN